MKVGQEQGFGITNGYTHVAQVAGCAFACVDDEDPVTGDDDRTGSGAAGVRKGRTGAAQSQVQTIGQIGHDIATYLGVRNAL